MRSLQRIFSLKPLLIWVLMHQIAFPAALFAAPPTGGSSSLPHHPLEVVANSSIPPEAHLAPADEAVLEQINRAISTNTIDQVELDLSTDDKNGWYLNGQYVVKVSSGDRWYVDRPHYGKDAPTIPPGAVARLLKINNLVGGEGISLSLTGYDYEHHIPLRGRWVLGADWDQDVLELLLNDGTHMAFDMSEVRRFLFKKPIAICTVGKLKTHTQGLPNVTGIRYAWVNPENFDESRNGRLVIPSRDVKKQRYLVATATRKTAAGFSAMVEKGRYTPFHPSIAHLHPYVRHGDTLYMGQDPELGEVIVGICPQNTVARQIQSQMIVLRKEVQSVSVDAREALAATMKMFIEQRDLMAARTSTPEDVMKYFQASEGDAHRQMPVEVIDSILKHIEKRINAPQGRFTMAEWKDQHTYFSKLKESVIASGDAWQNEMFTGFRRALYNSGELYSKIDVGAAYEALTAHARRTKDWAMAHPYKAGAVGAAGTTAAYFSVDMLNFVQARFLAMSPIYTDAPYLQTLWSESIPGMMVMGGVIVAASLVMAPFTQYNFMQLQYNACVRGFARLAAHPIRWAYAPIGATGRLAAWAANRLPKPVTSTGGSAPETEVTEGAENESDLEAPAEAPAMFQSNEARGSRRGDTRLPVERPRPRLVDRARTALQGYSEATRMGYAAFAAGKDAEVLPLFGVDDVVGDDASDIDPMEARNEKLRIHNQRERIATYAAASLAGQQIQVDSGSVWSLGASLDPTTPVGIDRAMEIRSIILDELEKLSHSSWKALFSTVSPDAFVEKVMELKNNAVRLAQSGERAKWWNRAGRHAKTVAKLYLMRKFCNFSESTYEDLANMEFTDSLAKQIFYHQWVDYVFSLWVATHFGKMASNVIENRHAQDGAFLSTHPVAVAENGQQLAIGSSRGPASEGMTFAEDTARANRAHGSSNELSLTEQTGSIPLTKEVVRFTRTLMDLTTTQPGAYAYRTQRNGRIKLAIPTFILGFVPWMLIACIAPETLNGEHAGQHWTTTLSQGHTWQMAAYMQFMFMARAIWSFALPAIFISPAERVYYGGIETKYKGYVALRDSLYESYRLGIEEEAEKHLPLFLDYIDKNANLTPEARPAREADEGILEYTHRVIQHYQEHPAFAQEARASLRVGINLGYSFASTVLAYFMYMQNQERAKADPKFIFANETDWTLAVNWTDWDIITHIPEHDGALGVCLKSFVYTQVLYSAQMLLNFTVSKVKLAKRRSAVHKAMKRLRAAEKRGDTEEAKQIWEKEIPELIAAFREARTKHHGAVAGLKAPLIVSAPGAAVKAAVATTSWAQAKIKLMSLKSQYDGLAQKLAKAADEDAAKKLRDEMSDLEVERDELIGAYQTNVRELAKTTGGDFIIGGLAWIGNKTRACANYIFGRGRSLTPLGQ